jgi:integral membrane protein (TIGR01906 family)
MDPVDGRRRRADVGQGPLTPAPRAWAVGFVWAAALLIVLSGPLILFNPWFVSWEQGRHDVPAAFAATQAQVDAVTAPMVFDLFRMGDFGESFDGATPILTEPERSHMRDVGGLVRTLVIIEVAALVIFALGWWRLRAERPRRGRLLLVGAALVGGASIVLAVIFAVAFDFAFGAFHALFFKAGTWQFSIDSGLIRLFPEPFWFDASLLAGGSIVVGALIAALVARRDLRRPSAVR